MRALVTVSISMILAAWLVLAPTVSEAAEEPDVSGMNRLAAHFAEWNLDEEPEFLVEHKEHGNSWARRCGTPPPTSEFLRESRLELALLETATEAEGVVLKNVEVRVPIVFHIVRRTDGKGSVSNERLAENVRLMNKAYRRFGTEFYVLTVKEIVKNGWYKKCMPLKKNGNLNKKYFKMTRRNAVDPASVVNVYTCKPHSGIAGFGVPAGFLAEDDPNNAIIVHHDFIYGGPYFGYDEGATLIHEVGHYFGLWHTFHPGLPDDPVGCEPPGDEVSDTPYEAEPSYACIPRDTCPQEGMDPIENFMDYSPDTCVERFTRKQRKRMENMTFLYRPTLFGY